MSSEEDKDDHHPYRDGLFTWMSFVLAIVSIPAFCFCYLTTSISRFVLLRLLKTMYPEMEFIKSMSIRSAMDTPNNIGYVVVLLKVIGDYDINLMKHTIQTDIVDKYDRISGCLCFPHLRCSLTKKWLRYAWTKAEFSIDNHVIESDTAASEDDITQRVNDIIAAVIPAELPQWRITMIPSRDEDSFYLLVRIHHLYASEDGVGLGDLLLLRPEIDAAGQHQQHQQQQQQQQHQQQQYPDEDSIQNILSTVYQAPTALPRLGEHLSEICANAWNELVVTYDPLENPKAFQQRRPNVFALAAVVAIAGASAARDRSSGSGHGKRQRRFGRKLRRELARRGVRFRYAFRCVVHTFHPALWASFAWWLFVKCALRLPITAMLAVRNASTYVYWSYVLLYSAYELLYLAGLAYRAPGTVIRELVLPLFGGGPSPYLRRAGGGGGGGGGVKCVAWSRPVGCDLVNTVHDNTGAATCEIQLSMLAAALQEHFAVTGDGGGTVMTTTRFVAKANLFQLNNRHAIVNGLLALPLPMGTGGEPIYSLLKMQECLQEAIGNQTALYIASMWQIDHSLATSFLPSPVVSLGLRLLSNNYPLSVTYVEEHKLDRKRRRLLWGQEVDAVLYWRPPQSNVRMSLSVINYGGNLRLAVMTDTEMSPPCHNITAIYEKNIPAFVSAAENYAGIVNTSD